MFSLLTGIIAEEFSMGDLGIADFADKVSVPVVVVRQGVKSGAPRTGVTHGLTSGDL